MDVASLAPSVHEEDISEVEDGGADLEEAALFFSGESDGVHRLLGGVELVQVVHAVHLELARAEEVIVAVRGAQAKLLVLAPGAGGAELVEYMERALAFFGLGNSDLRGGGE